MQGLDLSRIRLVLGLVWVFANRTPFSVPDPAALGANVTNQDAGLAWPGLRDPVVGSELCSFMHQHSTAQQLQTLHCRVAPG